MEKSKKKLARWQLRTIIVSSISAVIALVLIITNIFIPVKYLSSYMVFANDKVEEGIMRVRFVDVGYGDCTVVEFPDGKTMLIDGGNGRSSNQSKILKILNKSGIDEIDYLICTTVNSENCGGLAEIINFKTVKRIYMPFCRVPYITNEYRNFHRAANASGAEEIISEYGSGEGNADCDYFFRILSPSYFSNPSGEYQEMNENPESAVARNNASAVVWIEYAGTSLLVASDAGEQALTNICNSYGAPDEYAVNLSECDIVTVANHGNALSACEMFYDLISPEVAIVSVGENGRGCPSAEVMSDVAEHVGEQIYRTDERGTITVEVASDGYEVKF